MMVTDTKKQLIVEGNNNCEDWDWENTCDAITEAMKKFNTNRWHVEVKNFSWRSLSGESDFKAENGYELLLGVLPQKTENAFRVYLADDEKGIMINNAHHDSPMWLEWYTISPIKENVDEGIS